MSEKDYTAEKREDGYILVHLPEETQYLLTQGEARRLRDSLDAILPVAFALTADQLAAEVVRLARLFVMWKNEYLNAVNDDHCDPAGAHCLALQVEISAAERALDVAVEELEEWENTSDWKESEGSK